MRHALIAPEGRWAVLGLVLLAALVWAWRPPLALPVLVAAVLLAWLFRDPWREIPAAPLGLVSPVDGRVLEAGPAGDPFLHRPALRVVLRVAAAGPLVLRSVTEGRVQRVWVGGLPGAAPGQRGLAHWVRTDEGDDVVLAVYTPRGWPGLRSRLAAGERVGQGQRYGLVPPASRVEVWLPEHSRLQVAPGRRLCAGSHLLGRLVHG